MFVFLVFIISTVINAVVACAQSDICNTTCSPFRLLVIWHTSNGEDAAFEQEKRFIIQLLLNIPEGTEIHVTAINTQRYHLLHFKNNKTIDWKDWIRNISMYKPERLENHTINGSLINETFFSFRKQNDKREVTELTVLVVSEKTLIENGLETIQNIKRFVVFTGKNKPPLLWTSLATDRQHVVMLNMTSESIEANIIGTADTVLDLLCRDYRWHSLENAYKEADKNITVKRCEPNNDQIFISIIIVLSVLATIAFAAVCVLLLRGRTHLDQETSRSHETIEIRAEQERSFI